MLKATERGDVLSEEIRSFLELYSTPLWDEAKAKSEERGEVLSEVIREALKRYAKSKSPGR